jgi:hypothetical protein
MLGSFFARGIDRAVACANASVLHNAMRTVGFCGHGFKGIGEAHSAMRLAREIAIVLRNREDRRSVDHSPGNGSRM